MKKEDLIKKWINDDLSEEELKAFQALEESAFYKKIVNDAHLFKAPEFKPSTDLEVIMTDNRSSIKDIRTRWYSHALKLAGVIALILVAYFVFLDKKNESFNTLTAQTKELTLPDGSTVTLNAVSTLSYDPASWDNNRQLKLDGEALFKVKPGSDFKVETDNGSVSVLGTVFNVKTRSSSLSVACYEGIVRVASGSKSKNLNAGEAVTVVENEMINATINYKNPGWMNGVSRFNRSDISEVFAELERQYGVKVNPLDVNMTRKFTGAFSNTHLDSALQAITVPMNLHYTITNDKEITVTKQP